MDKIERSDIELLARHSDWPASDVRRTLEQEVYAHEGNWQRLLQYLLLGAGAAFLLSGIVFFFAYNWADLPRLVKVGTVIGLFALTGLFGIFAPVGRQARNVSLTAAVVLIGIVMAVLGQVYQSGANSYVLFFSWTLFALPWVAVVYFSPLWLLLVGLINVSFFTYVAQRGLYEDIIYTGLLLFFLNLLCWGILYLIWRRRASFNWLLNVVALWIAVIATVNISAGMFSEVPEQTVIMLLAVVITYGSWYILGMRQRSIFYPAVVGTSSVISLTFVFIRLTSGDIGVVFVAGLLALGGMTVLANYLNKLNKQWRDER